MALEIAGNVYLKPSVKLEPLACGWYATPHLISPVQHAMNIAFRHLPIMRSFIANPAVHKSAMRDPKLFGGPFMDVDSGDVQTVRDLLSYTLKNCEMLIDFATQFREFDDKLQNSADGYSLDEFRRCVPDLLAGAVEIMYDLNDHARVRFFEEFVYEMDMNSHTQQICLSLTPEGDRKFFMSTPRLKSPQRVILSMPFSDSRIDVLSKMRSEALDLEKVALELGVEDSDLNVFSTFFTHDAPEISYRAHLGGGVRIKYFGHACVLIETSEVSILIDPMFAWDRDINDGRFTFNDLPSYIDYVVITHNHQDHCCIEPLLQLRCRIGKIIVPRNDAGNPADPSLKIMLKHLGFQNIDDVPLFHQENIAGGSILTLPFSGEHCDLDIYSKHGIFLEIKGKKILFLVDSDITDPVLYRRLSDKFGGAVDVIFIGMECRGAPFTWLYGPLRTKPISRRNDESRRLSGSDSRKALRIINEIGADKVFVYAMGYEPWLRYIMGLEYADDSFQLSEVKKLLELCSENNQNIVNLKGCFEVLI